MEQVKEAWTKVNRFRDGLNLPNPGTFEGVNREVKRKLLSESLRTRSVGREAGEMQGLATRFFCTSRLITLDDSLSRKGRLFRELPRFCRGRQLLANEQEE